MGSLGVWWDFAGVREVSIRFLGHLVGYRGVSRDINLDCWVSMGSLDFSGFLRTQ